MKMTTLLLSALAALLVSQASAGPAFTKAVPGNAVYYRPKDPNKFDLTDFNTFLYSPAAGNAGWVVVPAGEYFCNPNINDNFGHWNLHNMVIDMRGVKLWLTHPQSISYWDVETNLTIVGLTLWSNKEMWTQGVVQSASQNGDGTVQVTVQTDTGYDSSIWYNGVTPVQPLRFMDANMVAISGCQGLWATNGNYRDVGNNKVTFSVRPYNECPASKITANMRFAKNTGGSWPQIIQEYSQINWIDITTNLFADSYGGSNPFYQNFYLINSPTPKGASVRRSHPAYFQVQGWGYPSTGSWYYLGYNPNGLDAKPTIDNAVTQNSADPTDLVSWW